MAGAYLVRPLARDQLPQAFPLVSMFDVALTMERWLGYASALTEASDDPADRQILSVQSGQGHIYGVSAYWLKPDLRRALRAAPRSGRSARPIRRGAAGARA